MSDHQARPIVDTYLRLILLSLLLFWCLSLIMPFLHVMVWSIILAMAMSPLYNSLLPRFKNKKVLTAAFLVLIGLAIIIIPSLLFVESIIEGVRELKGRFAADTLTIPPPTPEIADLPVVGKPLFDAWQSASENLQGFIMSNKDVLAEYGKSFIDGLLSIGGSVVKFILSTVIAGVLLVTPGTKETADKIFVKVIGPRGKEFADLSQRTVNNVVKGVLGVALIQAFLTGVGFLLAGVPYAGIWALLVLILAILQLPTVLVVLPVILYLFSTLGTLSAILWSVFLMLAGLSDNFLKPILLGKGAPVPMPVIFLGVIGGFVTMGFIGLFIGAIVLSMGYLLMVAWLNDTPDVEPQNTKVLDN